MSILRGELKLVSKEPNKDGHYSLLFTERCDVSKHKLKCTYDTLKQQFSNHSLEVALGGIGCDYNTETKHLLSDALYADRFIGALGGIDWQLSHKFS